MHKDKAGAIKNWKLTVRKTIAIGVVLLIVVTMLAGHWELHSMSELTDNTMDTLKQQCISFNKLVAADRTKSLFRLTDMLRDLSNRLREEPELATDAYLEEYVDRLRISGIALLDENLQLQASGYTRRFRNSTWEEAPRTGRFDDIVTYPTKIFAERIAVRGEYYDVCAVARKDVAGIVVGFYQQPTGLISSTENDMESLLTGLHLDRRGNYAIAENDFVRATSDHDLKDKVVAESTVLQQLAQVPFNSGLHLIRAEGKLYYGCRSGCEGYMLSVYYPITSVFSRTITIAAIFAAMYLIFCLIYFAMRNRTLYENQAELRESNRKMTETVKMLKSMETIYFTLFYVDLGQNQYETIYLAPWLENTIPHKGVYTKLKEVFLETMVVPDFREEVDHRMSQEFIRENLSQKKITDARKSFYTDYQAIRGNEIKWCRVSATVVDYDEAGEPIHVLALLQDVDEEKAKESAYQSRILEEAHQARVANDAKSEFLRRISHDIRTPINGIQGYIDMGASHPEDAALQTYCWGKAKAALNTLMMLVNSVLDMSKLENSEISLEEKAFDLNQLLADINTVLEPQAISQNIHYEIQRQGDLPFPHLIGSPRHLSQVLMNLASNAIKYGKPGGFVRLNTHLAAQTEKEVIYEFTCEDNGIGMSEEFQKHLFEPFTQEAVNARTTYAGTGLGLSIVKKLVDALGGTITWHSEKDVGTTFQVRLTFQIDPAYGEMPQMPLEENTEPLQGVHALLVEDNELNMEIAEFLLSKNGAQITQAWNGQEAVDAFAASDYGFYDIIFMDIMMPIMNGLEAAQAIRALDRPDAKTVLISAMSANAFSDDVQRSLDAGMDAHISKPVDEKKLLAVTAKLLNEREKNREG